MNSSQPELGYFSLMPVQCGHLSTELNSDFTLPDYKCEMRRLLSVKAYIVPPSEYQSGGSAQLDGDINYKILYLGADGELYSLDLNDKYSFKLPLNFNPHSVNPDEITFITQVKDESISARVTGPRKISLKSRLTLHSLCLSPELYTANLVGSHNRSSIENLVLNTPVANIKKCASELQIINDFISLDGAADNARVIDCQASTAISECVSSNGLMNVRGELIFKVLYCDDTQSVLPLCSIRKVPFSTAIACDEVNNSYECSCYAVITDTKSEVKENGISLEAAFTLYATAQKNENASYVSDAYSTEKEAEISHLNVSLLQALKASIGNLTQNEAYSLEDLSIPADSKIIDVCANATIDDFCAENLRLIIKGKCDYQVIYHFDGEYSCKEVRAPFKYELSYKLAQENCENYKWWAHATPSFSKVRSDGQKLFIDCELFFNILAFTENSIMVLNEMIFGQARESRSGELLLCYPEQKSKLWTVAKQYGKPVSAIKKRNSLPENETEIKRRFLII